MASPSARRAWSQAPEVVEQVEAMRRQVVHQTVGQLCGKATAAVAEIARLMTDGNSESVRLQAARAVLADLMAISSFAALNGRMAELERVVREGARPSAIGTAPGADPCALDRGASDRWSLARGGSVMSSVNRLAAHVARLEKVVGPAVSATADRSPWDWYAGRARAGWPPANARSTRGPGRPSARPAATGGRGCSLGGRAAGKTRSAAELVRYWAESGQARRIGLVAPTAADYRDTMIQGPSGLLAIAPPWNRPRFEPSKRRLTWPNGAVAICLSADRARAGPRAPVRPAVVRRALRLAVPGRMWETVLLCLRLGTQPRTVVTTTPKPIELLSRILDDPTTRLSKETTFANARHLAPEFITEITAMYEGTRLGDQELKAEIVDTSAAACGSRRSPARHVMEQAEYVPGRRSGWRSTAGCRGTSGRCSSRTASATARGGERPADPLRVRRLLRGGSDEPRQRGGDPGAVASAVRGADRSGVPGPGVTARSGSGRRRGASSRGCWASGSPSAGRCIGCWRAWTRSKSCWARRRGSRTCGSTRGAGS